ncbi:hypothetical protein RF11_16301 [Thelohanellus kitauei]|uniref:Uncharacterized protein n=1 Tax=Thelohanellus kitauei TaxID=669202 RepID=A0A0C2MR79_THEKT|nr:hypothetical protein RF11_16301 [Thelohanellus kitauei]
MSPRIYLSEGDRYSAIKDYKNNSKSSSLHIQIEAIKTAIRIFSPHYKIDADTAFIKHFPTNVHKEFKRMVNSTTIVNEYNEMKILFFDVFIFLFRNNLLIDHIKAKPFIELFLQFIKIKNDKEVYDAKNLLNSIQQCILL